MTMLYYCSFLLLVLKSAYAAPVFPRETENSLSEYPDPLLCTGNCSWIHDPSIVYENGTYWRFSTSGNIAVAAAPSLEGPWDYKGALLDKGTNIFVDEEQDIWAPSVVKVHDTYYAYYSVSTMGSRASEIGVATSTSLEPGTWLDHGSLNLPKSPNYNLIDPNLFVDYINGRWGKPTLFFSFGSYWEGIHQMELQENTLISMESNIGTHQLNNIIRNSSTDPAVVEGAYQFKHNDWYYVFYSVGQCCNTPPELAPPGDEYRIVVCRSVAMDGAFVDRETKSCYDQSGGTTILATHGDVYAPGGQGLMVEEESGKVVLYYHYVRPSVGYNADQFFFGYNYLEFDDDDWPVVT